MYSKIFMQFDNVKVVKFDPIVTAPDLQIILHFNKSNRKGEKEKHSVTIDVKQFRKAFIQMLQEDNYQLAIPLSDYDKFDLHGRDFWLEFHHDEKITEVKSRQDVNFRYNKIAECNVYEFVDRQIGKAKGKAPPPKFGKERFLSEVETRNTELPDVLERKRQESFDYAKATNAGMFSQHNSKHSSRNSKHSSAAEEEQQKCTIS